MNRPRGNPGRRFALWSVILAVMVAALLFHLQRLLTLERPLWMALLGGWSVLIFALAILQMRALVEWLNPPEESEEETS